MRGRALALALAVVVAACTSGVQRADDPRPDEGGPNASVDDLSSVIDRSRHAFEPSRDGFHGAGTSYASDVDADGTLHVTPTGASVGLAVVTVEPRAEGRAHFDASSLITPRAGGVVEHVENRDTGVEQWWELTERPRDGIVVRVRASGLPFVTSTSRGHHFRDGASGRGVRYGAATWIDADGKRTPIAVVREGDDLVMRVSRELASSSTFPAVLDPTLSPEADVDTALFTATASTGPVTVTDGPSGQFLAFWSGAFRRIAANGTLLGTETPTGITGGYANCVAFDPVDARWLVVWSNGQKTLGERFDANGVLLDTTPIAVDNNYSGTCKVAWNGTSFAVSTIQSSSTNTVVVDFVSPAGSVVAPGPLSFAMASYGYGLQGACLSSGQCLDAWTINGDVYVARFDNSGIVASAVKVATGAYSGATPAVGSDGASGYIVAWQTSTGEVTAIRISNAGVIADSPALDIGQSQLGYPPAVTWDGTSFVIGYTTTTDMRARRVPASGAITSAAVVLSTGTRSEVQLATSNGQMFASWTSTSARGSRISAALAQLDGADGIPLAPRWNTQTKPRVAWNGENFLVVWEDDRNGALEGWSTLLSKTGAPLSATAKRLSDKMNSPIVASDGKDFLAVWTTYTPPNAKLNASRVSGTTGALLDTTPLSLGNKVNSIDAAGLVFDGQNYIVCWGETADYYLNQGDLYCARISPAGMVLDPNGFLVSGTPEQEHRPVLASDGKTGSLIVWEHEYNYFDIHARAARLDRAGAVLDPNGFDIGSSLQQEDMRVAWNGREYEVVWNDLTTSRDRYVVGVRIAGGKLLDSPAVSFYPTVGGQIADVAALDPATSLVVFAANEGTGPTARTVIDGIRVRHPSFLTLDKTPIEIGGGVGAPAGHPTIGIPGVGTGKALVVYEHSDTNLSPPSVRINTRLVDFGKGAGTACAAADECASGSCTDGVCCDTSCTTQCQACGKSGICENVIGPDPDTCMGAFACGAGGACRRADGQVCEAAVDCASGFCAGGVCCQTACDGACSTCGDIRGTCTPSAPGTIGRPSCAPFRCNGRELTCPAKCLGDADCADGFGCDVPTGTCVSGSACIDDHTARAPNGTRSTCSPYACRLGVCLGSCESVADCAYPAACDEQKHCINTTVIEPSGCSSAPVVPRGTTWLGLLGFLLFLRRRR